jgi:adenylosuccinate lyase
MGTEAKNVSRIEAEGDGIVISGLTPEQSQALDLIVHRTNRVIRQLNNKIKRLEKELKAANGSRNWYKEAYEIVTGGTNPL